MTERDAAIRIVEAELERTYRRESAAGLAPLRMAVAGVEAHELAWIVDWTSEEYLRTGDDRFLLAGNGPYLVDRVDGSLHSIGVLSAMSGAWEADYRARVRGQTVRSAVDDLHDEVRAATVERGRVHAMRVLRRKVPELSPAQAVAYVAALNAGAAPARLVAVAAARLVPPVDPVMSVRTIRGGRPAPG